ncbi:MAG TPA: SRPBCC domain-containing protein [Agromyces sp.]|nr:SRPBCC domain-containing protein [Agromyces sp.]
MDEHEMGERYVSTSTIRIDARRDRVWAVLTDPNAAREFMFGTELETDWSIGGPILWRGVHHGTPYEDRGVVLEFEPGRRLVHTHFSPLGGADDLPENHHTLTWTLDAEPSVGAAGEAGTVLTLSQDNNATREAAEHSRGMWDQLVAKVKEIAERS